MLVIVCYIQQATAGAIAVIWFSIVSIFICV